MIISTRTFKPRTLARTLAFLALSTLASAAMAQYRPATDGWQYTLGAGAIAVPKSIGSDSTESMLVPNLQVQYKDWLYFSPLEGLGVKTTSGGLTASMALAPDLNVRNPDAGLRFNGLTRVNTTAAARLKLDYELNEYTASAVISSRLTDSQSQGTTLALEGGYNFLATKKFLFNAGLTARYMDSKFAENLMSVSSADSATSGLPTYLAKSGLLDVGIYGQAIYRIDNQWSIFSRLEVARLEGDAANSPFVEKRTTPSLLLFANYAF